MLVHLLRHGVASDTSPTGHDDDRPLTDEGRRKLKAAAAAFRKAIGSELGRIVASPLVRAQQTARLVAEECRLAEAGATEIETSSDLVHAVPAGVPIDTLIEPALADDCHSILLVGHEPQLGSLLARLVTGIDASIPLRKGMLVGIELPSRTSLVGRLLYALPTRVAKLVS
jgi:phosphohistidine phosphatase